MWERLAQRKRPAPPPMEARPAPRQDRRAEIQRIMDLPRCSPEPWQGGALIKNAGLDLRPVQKAALGAIVAAQGGLFPIGVGHGKTFIALLAGAALGADLAILLTPPSTVAQVYQALARVDSHYRIPRTEVIAYSMLSRPDASDLLRRLVAGVDPAKVVLIADEAHSLKHHTSARTKRVARFLQEYPQVRFVAMSGTLTSKSIKDFAHLAEWALHEGSPVPRPHAPQGMVALEHWAAAIDSDGRGGVADLVWCQPLWSWAGKQPADLMEAAARERKEGLRSALHERMTTAKGVVATDQSSFGASLYVEHLKPALPRVLADMMAQVEATKCDPSGEPLESPVDQWRILRQLSMGFWYRWVWPNGIPDNEWIEARAAWARHVRSQLDNHAAEGYDSPMLVFNRIAREHAAGQRLSIHRAWAAWKAVKHRPAPPVEAVWVTGDVLDAGLREVLKSKEPTLVWYSDNAVADALAQRGLTVIRAGQAVPTEARTVCVSWRSHGTGLNLQKWAHNLVLTPSPSGMDWEQMIGRTHRYGQQEDEVWVRVLAHSPAFVEALRGAMANAEYLQHTTGQAQKLLMACHIGK